MRGLLLIGMLALAAPAWADEPAKSLRMVGEASAPAPKAFVVDAMIEAGDGAFQREVSGWAATLPPDTVGGEVKGTCIETRCALTFDFDGQTVEVSADVGAGNGGAGRFSIASEEEGGKPTTGTVSFKPLAGPAPEFGELAPPGSITAAELADLLVWAGSDVGFNNPDSTDLPDSFELDSLADWQAASGRPGSGLILTADLKALRDNRAAVQASSGWKPLSGTGWKAGYPATLLSKSSTAGTEQQFGGADGKAILLIAVVPPLSGDAFDALVETLTADNDERNRVNYTRVNSDLEMSWLEKGEAHVVVVHNRENGMARLSFSYPEDQGETYDAFARVLPRAFRVDDDLKPR